MTTCTADAESMDARSTAGCSRLQLAVIVLVALFYLATLRHGHNWGGDFAQYILHARNIATSQPYDETGYVYNLMHPEIGPRAYPPIFPLSLSPVYAAFGLDLTAFKAQLVLVFALSLLVTAKLFSVSLRPSQLIVYLLVVGLCPIFWVQKDAVDSEHLFILLWYLSILVADRWYRQGALFRSQWLHAAMLGFLIYLTYGTRTVGIVLLPTVVLCDLIRFRRLTVFGSLTIATALILMLIEKAILPSSGAGYLDQINKIDLRSTLGNLRTNLVAFSMIWENGHSDAIRKVAGTLLSLVAMIGFLRQNLPRPSTLAIAMLLYFGLIVVWPSASWIRMVLPLFPAYVFYVLVGMDFSFMPVSWQRAMLAGLCAFSMLSYAVWYRQANFVEVEGVANDSAVDLFRFVRDATEDDELCLFFKPRVLSLYTGRPATAYPNDRHADQVWEYAKASGVKLVIVRDDPLLIPEWDMSHCAERELLKQSDELREVWRNDSFRAYRLRH